MECNSVFISQMECTIACNAYCVPCHHGHDNLIDNSCRKSRCASDIATTWGPCGFSFIFLNRSTRGFCKNYDHVYMANINTVNIVTMNCRGLADKNFYFDALN